MQEQELDDDDELEEDEVAAEGAAVGETGPAAIMGIVYGIG